MHLVVVDTVLRSNEGSVGGAVGALGDVSTCRGEPSESGERVPVASARGALMGRRDGDCQIG